jgi:cytochrome b involved in lipid metabolism
MVKLNKIMVLALLVVALVMFFGCTQAANQVDNNPVGITPSTDVDQTQTSTDITPGGSTGTSAGSESVNPDAETPSAPEVAALTVTAAELAMHNSESDCWVSYDGEVYDITAFLPIHPGGVARIAPYCGTSKEFQQAFTNQHGTSKVSRLKRQVFKGTLEG